MSKAVVYLIDDPVLHIYAESVTDAEKTRIATENRVRQLLRGGPNDLRICDCEDGCKNKSAHKVESYEEFLDKGLDKDEDDEDRGFAKTLDELGVKELILIRDNLIKVEEYTVKQLEKQMKANPLGDYIASVKGLGNKQAARLIAATGDPYWNMLYDRPRTVSELWAYCGLHVLESGAAPKRQKGQQANWSAEAKMRCWNIAGSMLKSGNRETYDKRKAATEDRLHRFECVRCGPAKNPAKIGTPWSDAHRHADALRVVSKELLKGLWIEARRLHGVTD